MKEWKRQNHVGLLATVKQWNDQFSRCGWLDLDVGNIDLGDMTLTMSSMGVVDMTSEQEVQGMKFTLAWGALKIEQT